jgi:hypothetical protein
MQHRLLMIEKANPLSVEIYIFDRATYINYHQDYQGIEIKKTEDNFFGHNIIGYSIIVISILLTIVYSLLLSSIVESKLDVIVVHYII